MKGAIFLKNCNCNNGSHSNGCNRRRRCGCMKLARSCWENFPYYTGPCPNIDGCYGWCGCNGSGGNSNGSGSNCNCRCNCNCTCNCEDNDDNESEQTCDYDRCYRRCRRRCREWCMAECDNDDDNDEDCGCEPCHCGHQHYRRCRRRRRCRCKGPCCGMFLANLPMAVGPSGIIPLVFNNPCKDENFEVNSGLVKLEREGTYLATYTVRVPETAALDTTITLNVDNATQSGATTEVLTEAGTTNSAYTGQAIFQADEGDTVSLRTSEAINVTETAAQPLFTLSLVRLDSE